MTNSNNSSVTIARLCIYFWQMVFVRWFVQFTTEFPSISMTHAEIIVCGHGTWLLYYLAIYGILVWNRDNFERKYGQNGCCWPQEIRLYIHLSFVGPAKMYLRLLHIKFGLIKNVVKAMHKIGYGFIYSIPTFPRISDTKLSCMILDQRTAERWKFWRCA